MSVQIGPITPSIVSSYSQVGLDYTLSGILKDKAQHDELEELFWGCDYETDLRHIMGTRLYGVDYTLDQRYVQYVQFVATHGPKTGWYLLRGLTVFADESALGMSYPFTCELRFFGTNATLKQGFKLFGLSIRRNDWLI